MKLWSALLVSFPMVAAAASLAAQTPVLSTIQAPYAPVQAQVQMAGKIYVSGTVAYGAVATPLVLSGSGLGDNGVVWFVPYKNGALDTNTPPVQGVVTLWTASQIFLRVPSGAVSGLVEVLTADSISNGLPFVVTPGTYSNSCPAGPSAGQLQITTDSLQNGTANHSYSAQLTAAGGSNTYTWTVVSGSLPAGLSLSGSGLISGTPTAATNAVSFAVQAVDTSTPPLHDEATLSLAVAAEPEAASSATLYNFSIQTSGGGAEGYDSVGNVTGYTDSVNGTWSFAYDSINRLATATGSQDNNINPNYCWNYDSFGNRTMQMSASVPFASGMGGPNQGSQVCSTTGSLGQTIPAQYNANNQISDGLHQYDTSGDVTQDATTGNYYLYDADGRLCAMQQSIAGTTVMIGYIYNAEGVRVAKGTISTLSCNTTSNGFTATTVYVLGPSGEHMTEMTNNAGTWQWKHTNVDASGLSATYDADSTGQTAGQIYFHLSDWLGTRRQQTDYAGNPLLNFTGLPYGDGLSTIPVSTTDVADATEHHFTGKERDSESGNDYFGARYYASSMGRYMSPDWTNAPQPVPYADLRNPQSLNLYGYVDNNPLSKHDEDGHCTADGETHGAVWCWFHDHGLFGVETAKERQTDQANEARKFITANRIDAIKVNGSWQPSSSSNDSDVASWWKDYNDSYRDDLGQGISAAGAFGALTGRIGGGGAPLTNAQVKDLAKWSGMEPVKDAPFDSHGQKVFKIGNRYFTPDVDGHIGGVWKEFDRQGNRIGTLDVNLNRIGK